ncbi:hypothetical protein [Leucobacter massiliensis]|uniref:hypothetical protein n=1 Tax=Leucobacter massiliensis TaxID=1686285 RepID=UPI0011B1E137|nr:hypothetical protein [Leucobacter massiliensis]
MLFNVFLAVERAVSNEVLGSIRESTGIETSALVGTVLIVLLFALVALVTVTPLKHAGWAWLTYAGSLTFPLYLMHEYWGWWAIGLVDPVAGKWLALLAAFGISFACAVAIERWVERPLRPRIRRSLQWSLDDRGLRSGRPSGVASQ